MPTIRDLAEQIEKKSLTDLTKLPRKARIVWYSKMQAMEVSLLYPLADSDAKRQEMLQSLYPTIWLRGEATPFNSDMLIFEMFEDGEEYRVYACPKADAKPKMRDGKPLPIAPNIYRLSKRAPLVSQDLISYETLVDLVAEEWAMVDEGISTAERERGLILAHIEAQPTDYSMSELLDDIREERHHETEEEDDEEGEEEEDEEEQTGLAAPQPPPAPEPPASPAA